MFICDKCGAHLEDGMKYCDKCGSEVNPNDEKNPDIIGLEDIKPLEKNEEASRGGLGMYIDKFISILPHPLSSKGDRTALMIGVASIGLLALVYLICFFVFMPDMCLSVAIGSFAKYAGDVLNFSGGASAIWMIAFFALNLFPLYFAICAFLKKPYRYYSIFAMLASFVLTVITFISWGICAPSSIVEALGIYGSSGSVAWFVLADALSEVWYLKIILSLLAVFGFGVDYIINK